MRNRLAILAIGVLAVTASGCAGFMPGGKEYMSTDYTVTKDAQLKKAYADCLKRNNNDETKCKKEKDDMLEQEEWNEMENSG